MYMWGSSVFTDALDNAVVLMGDCSHLKQDDEIFE